MNHQEPDHTKVPHNQCKCKPVHQEVVYTQNVPKHVQCVWMCLWMCVDVCVDVCVNVCECVCGYVIVRLYVVSVQDT